MEDFILRVCLALPGFVLAISFHEFAHAWAAFKYGDDTACRAGRMTINPAAHYDLFGTIILPLILAGLGMGIFGYAKPVPVNSRNFKNYKKAIFWVSFAGPLANIILFIISAFLLTLMITQVPQDFYLYDPFVQMLRSSVFINILLAVFNLIPFPPLDGSRMVSIFMNYDMARKYEGLQRFSIIFFLILWQTNLLGYLMRPALYLGSDIISLFYNMLV